MLTPAPVRSSWTSVTASGFAPHVLLHEHFRLVGPRTVQDVVRVHLDVGENLIDCAVDSAGSFRA